MLNICQAAEKGGLALVLSGGGARGFSQIGVIKAFEENDIYPQHVVGTSIGAIIGGLYSSGYSANDLDSIVRSTNWEGLLGFVENQNRTNKLPDQKSYFDRNLIRLRFDNFKLDLPEAISEGFPVRIYLQDLIWNAKYKTFNKFSELKYNFRAVATDIYNNKIVSLDSGNLVNSILASSAIPLRYPPVKIDSMVLVDGGVKANVPVASALEFEPDLVISINSTSPLHTYEELKSPINIADQVISILMKDISDSLMDLSDIVITPNIEQFKNDDFTNLDSLIELGYEAGLKAIEQYDLTRFSIKRDDKFTYIINDKFLEDILDRRRFSSTDELLEKLNSEGFDFATIKSEKSINSYERLLEIDLGKISRVDINTSTSSFLVKRDLDFEEGDFANVEYLNSSYEKLMSTGLFKSVNIQVLKENIETVVSVEAVENPKQNLLLGFRIDNYRNTQGGLDIYNDNVLDKGGRIGLRLAGGNRNQDLQLLIENPRIFSSFFSSKLVAYYSSYILESYEIDQVTNTSANVDFLNDYTIDRIGARFRIGGLLSSIGMLSLTYRFEAQRSYNTMESKTDYDYLSTIKLGTRIDSQDDKNFPTKGIDFNLFIESNVFSDPEVQFTKTYLNMLFVNKFGDHIVKPSLEIGIADRTLPFAEYFNLGGMNSFFGLHQVQSRGRQIFRSSLEYNYKLPIKVFFDTYLFGRYDIGSTWIEPEEIKVSGLRHGTGLGLAWDTPVGPAKFALGRLFYFISEPNSTVFGPVLFYFSIGTSISDLDY